MPSPFRLVLFFAGYQLLETPEALRIARSQSHADAGDVKAAIQRLTAFLAAPEVAAATDPEIRAARRRITGPVAARLV